MFTQKEHKLNMNFEWRFTKPSVLFPLAAAAESIKTGSNDFYSPDYNDSNWERVSVPHAPNAADSFDGLIRDAGEESLYRGFMFYRKSFTISLDAPQKFILEFESVRQSIYLYINGHFVGYYEAGTAPAGFDITTFVQNGENLIAVATDNAAYRECEFVTLETVPGNTPGDCSGERHQWNQKDFNEVQGGITGNVNLYVTDLIYLTRPLYNNLKTKGSYIYATDINPHTKSATINIDAELRNEYSVAKDISVKATIVENGALLTSFTSPVTCIYPASDAGTFLTTVVPADAYGTTPSPTNADTVSVSNIIFSAQVENLIFWSIDTPHLYDVYLSVICDGKAIDTQKITTGFRRVQYDIHRGGLLINDRPVYLSGYAQRSTDEWAAIGVANDWLYDYDMALVRQSNANYIRWMHVTPKPGAIRAGDKYGVVSVCPAGDKESDCEGRLWDMRMEAMRDAIIYFRNSPSVIFYEAGNAAISPEHMAEMTKLKNLLDPHGYRFMGCRSLTSPEQIKEAEWVGTMVYRYDAHAKQTMDDLNYHIPMLETEYKRDESPRRVWDDYSPPCYDYANKWLGDGAKKTDGYDVWDQTQEDFAVFSASEKDGYAYFHNNRVGGETGNNYYCGAAIMVWSDSNMHGRNSGSENCRTTGKVDPVRIKKQAFYALRAMQSDKIDVHILGHWNYPDDTPENYNHKIKKWNGTFFEPTGEIARRNPKDKTIYVVASKNCSYVNLYINGTLRGVSTAPADEYIHMFPHVDITEKGYIEAVAYDESGNRATHRINTVGEKAKIQLTLTTGPNGLIADGSDVCFFDVAVTDKDGNICPLADDKIDFELYGDGIFLGGYNSGKYGEESVIHQSYCYAECGINRVFVKSTLHGKGFTLTAKAKNLEECTVKVNTVPITISDGVCALPQQAQKANTVTFTSSAADIRTTRRQTVSKKLADEYSVIVNGKALSLSSPAYRPDSATGVLCPVREVLDALHIACTYSTAGKATLALSESGAVLIEGETAIHVGNETNLTNAEFYVRNGELIAELSAVLAYVTNVSVQTDSTKKEVLIDII